MQGDRDAPPLEHSPAPEPAPEPAPAPASAPSPSAPAQARLPLARTATRRRQSASERIHDIIETARQRAESAASDPLALHTTNTHRTMDSGRIAPDETTGIFSQGAGQSYLSLSKTSSSRQHNNNNNNNNNIIINNNNNPSTISAAKLKSQDDKAASSSMRRRHGADGNANGDNGGGGGGGHDGYDNGYSGRDEDDEDTVNGERPSWLRRGWARFQSLELENKGSVARDHLALERTFLAWLRTSLAFASIGVAVTQLFRLDTSTGNSDNNNSGGGGSSSSGVDGNTLRQMGRPLGTAFLAISILTLLLGCNRYYRAQEWILRGKFPASRGTILVMAFIALALMVLALVVIVAIQPPG